MKFPRSFYYSFIIRRSNFMASSVSTLSVCPDQIQRGYREMVRAPFTDKNGVKKGAWSVEEDRKLKAFVEKYGHLNWRELPRFAGLSRCGKSCRLRWINYLRPDVRRGNYSEEEETLIIKLREEHGNKWSMIAAKLPGRTDNEIKNHWHTHLKKRATRKSAAEQRSEESEFSDHDQSNSNGSRSSSEKEAILTVHSSSSSSSVYQILDSSSISSEAASSPRTSIAEHDLSSLSGNLWTEPFVADNLFNLADFDGFSNLPISLQYDDVVDSFFPENIWGHT